MERLKKQVIKHFLLISFGIALLESIVDSLFDDYFFKVIKDNTMQMKLAFLSYVVISILIFIIFAFIFYWVVNRKITEETRRQINEKNLLYANITHDLKTPITSILGFSKALKDKQVEPDQVDEILNIIFEKSKKTDELINTLFCYSKLETDSYELHIEEQDICALVRGLVAEAYQEFERKRMNLEIEISDQPMLCAIDSIELGRAMNNLILNAYKHNRNKTEVYISVKEKEGKVQIIVADNGEPIDGELMKTIFNPFVSGSESRSSKEGSGLGLAISRRVVEMHGGKLYIDEHIQGYTKGFVIEISR